MGKALGRARSFAGDYVFLVRESAGFLVPISIIGAAVLGAVFASMYLLQVHAALALVPFVALACAVWLYSWWDQWRYRRPRDVD